MPTVSASPEVSVGVPTFNRVATLERALASALGQTHRDLEVVVSDNASTDGTRDLCEALAARDQRLVYLRRERNVGPTENFNGLFARCARSPYALLLADDDWLDDDYVERCVTELRARPDHAVVGGRARYVTPAGGLVEEGRELQLQDEDAGRRVRDYLAGVEDNATFYGVRRGEALAATGPMRNVLGNDWHHVAGLVFQGKARMLDTTRVHRSLGGTSQTIEEILHTFGAPTTAQARLPYLFIAAFAFADIAWRSPAYATLNRPRRLALALRAAPRAVRWKYSAWHIAGPTLLRLRRRHRARAPVDALIRRGGGTPP